MSCHSERSEESDELLSKAKNTSTSAFQILRDAQDDNLIGEVHFDTPSFLFITHPLLLQMTSFS